MHFTDDLRKTSESKLLSFRSAEPATGGSGDSPELNAGLSLKQEHVSHDIAMLRRPAALETMRPPRLQEQHGLAHDARNIITSLELFSGLLAEPGVLSEEHLHYAGDLRLLTISLAVLMERMTSESRTQMAQGNDLAFRREPQRPTLASGRALGAAQPTGWKDQQNGQQSDAGVMVKSCERLLGAIAGPGVALNISYERNLGELSLSGEELTRVLINLVKNASEAMPSGGRVAITVRKGLGARPSAIISVQDTGIGVPPHAMGQIFQAGFSSKKEVHAWPSAKHHGLGLTIVRELVESAGGSVRVVSALKKGTTFEMKLPCRRA